MKRFCCRNLRVLWNFSFSNRKRLETEEMAWMQSGGAGLQSVQKIKLPAEMELLSVLSINSKLQCCVPNWSSASSSIRDKSERPFSTMYHYKKFLCLSVIALVIKQSSQSPVAPKAHEGNLDLNVDLSCIANVTCVNNVSNKVVRALNLRKVVDFGAFTIEPVSGAKATEGRSMSKFWEFASSNALRIPLGAYSLSLQKSEKYDNYLEVAVSKTEEGVFGYALQSFHSEYRECVSTFQVETVAPKSTCNSSFQRSW